MKMGVGGGVNHDILSNNTGEIMVCTDVNLLFESDCRVALLNLYSSLQLLKYLFSSNHLKPFLIVI